MKFLSQAVPRLHLQATALYLNRSGALSALVGRAPRANVLPPYVEARPSSLRASSQQDAAHSQKKQLACASIVGFDTIEGETEQTLRAEKSGARHRHWEKEEAFYVLEGSGVFSLNGVNHPIEKGATIFIPKNAWHGFTTAKHELLLLWVMAPAGLDGFFRETCNPPGVPPKQLTRDQIREIGGRYGTEYR
jgi:quercetin dioxygenase-like cupin family protein